MSDTLRDGLKTLVEFWRARANDTCCGTLAREHYDCRAEEIGALLEQTAPVEPTGVPVSSFTGSITFKLDEAEVREAHAKLAEILSKPAPFPASTEEPTVDSAGWVEYKDDPGVWYPAEYQRERHKYWTTRSAAYHEAVARVAMVPRPDLATNGATNA